MQSIGKIRRRIFCGREPVDFACRPPDRDFGTPEPRDGPDHHDEQDNDEQDGAPP